jgi:putative heme-binding domain-containing protein
MAPDSSGVESRNEVQMSELGDRIPRGLTIGGRTGRGLGLLVLVVGMAAAGDCRPAASAEAARLEIRKGDHIAFVGNTLADRMQHFGHLEARLHARFADQELVIRNLGFSGDEINLRLRSAGFGTPDEHLARVGADVILIFFGGNEAYRGPEGLAGFKKELDEYLAHLQGEKYNGSSAPRLALIAPLAHEDLKNPHLPDGRAHNANLALYSRAMGEVAAARGVPFVDLFSATSAVFDQAQAAHTINGIHLNDSGDALVAELIDQALFPDARLKLDAQRLEAIRQAVLDKNFYWFHRYRTTDGYSIYGERSHLKFVNGQSNREVMQREMAVLDVMTANRDRKIWAAAQGREYTVDDSNTPEFLTVISNKPGTGPNGAHVFLDPGAEAIGKMTVGKGLKVELVASEKEFPELINPVQMAFDTKGRMWVAVWPTYPHWKPKAEEMNDKLLILEDSDGDGKTDRVKTFADKLHNPTGFEFWGGGVLVAMAPDLLFLKDTDGDDKADVRVRVLTGLDSADTHHTANSFVLDPGGAMYFQEGTFHHTQVETPWGPPVRLANAGVFRYEPRTQKFEVYVAYDFANPHGHVFDRWGQDIVHDGTGANPYHGALFSGRTQFPRKHAPPPQVYQQRTRPCPGTEILSSRHFPEEYQGNLLVGNVIGFQGILRYRIEPAGGSLKGTELEPILSSSDPNFRPSDLEIGPDGALYFTDWHNPIIGHMQHNLRDPNRNKIHGRVYRVTYEGRPLEKPAVIAGASVDALLELLKSPEDRVRYRARIELSGRDTAEVIAAVKRWTRTLDPSDPEYQHHLMEGLWLHQSHDVVDEGYLRGMLDSREPYARAAAVRVLCGWRDRVPSVLDLLREKAADPEPRVRLEAVRAASFLDQPEAVEVVAIAREQPRDPYLDYVIGETLKTLEPVLQRAIDANTEIGWSTPAGERFLVGRMNLDQLLRQKRSELIYRELLKRPGVRDELRAEAASALAQASGRTAAAVLLEAIGALDAIPGEQATSVATDLVRNLVGRPAAELAPARGSIEELALKSSEPLVRQVAMLALLGIDRGPDRVWTLAAGTSRSLQDLLRAIPMASDASLRAAFYDRVEPLLRGVPAGIAGRGKQPLAGRYVRVELPRRGTLTLAEVEVISDGRNIARSGKASQSSTGHGGAAARAIDGNTSGAYGDGGQTHTEENIANPWWEVDLGDEQPIEAVVIYNRTDAGLGERLNGFSLIILDGDRQVVARKDGNPAPRKSVRLELEEESSPRSLRSAAMEALASVRGQEARTFAALAEFIRRGEDRGAAVKAIQRLPRGTWPAEQARPVLDALLGWIRTVPVADRTAPEALESLEFAEALAGLLPESEARGVRAELRSLGVRVVRISTIPERMSYDRETLALEAGKPVEILFSNADFMPHNFVITRPGALEPVGLLAESTGQQPDAPARQYVPASDQILLASRLLGTRETQKLSLSAPAEPGVYPFVCTYPGHWRRMYGAIYVVADLDAYLANPESYLASHPLEIKDELLRDRRPRTQWTFEDLASSVREMNHGRSLGNARQIFAVATCVACHKMEGQGQEFGPDLTQLDRQYTPEDILKQILEPSEKIDDKYRPVTFELESGRLLTGLILEETADAVQVIENPLAKGQPELIKKSEIAARQAAPASLMPKGLLDPLTRDEILDLIAYLTARGKWDHPLFQAESHGDHGAGAAHDHGAGHGHGQGHGQGQGRDHDRGRSAGAGPGGK